jgi:hypothetical protein
MIRVVSTLENEADMSVLTGLLSQIDPPKNL